MGFHFWSGPITSSSPVRRFSWSIFPSDWRSKVPSVFPLLSRTVKAMIFASGDRNQNGKVTLSPMLRPNQGKFVFSLLLALAFCAVVRAAAAAQITLVNQAKRTVQVKVELARTPGEWEKGLMFREHMPEKSGMLFVFLDDQIRTFWMKNTKIPLDMVFLDRDLRVVGIVTRAEPETLTPRYVKVPSRYVLEVNAGFCEKYGISVGDVAKLKDVP